LLFGVITPQIGNSQDDQAGRDPGRTPTARRSHNHDRLPARSQNRRKCDRLSGNGNGNRDCVPRRAARAATCRVGGSAAMQAGSQERRHRFVGTAPKAVRAESRPGDHAVSAENFFTRARCLSARPHGAPAAALSCYWSRHLCTVRADRRRPTGTRTPGLGNGRTRAVRWVLLWRCRPCRISATTTRLRIGNQVIPSIKNRFTKNPLRSRARARFP
jgi:hypothetical protein